MPRIFAYILHKAGVADDSAAELLAAAGKIDAATPPIAIVAGWGADLDAVCERSAPPTSRYGRSLMKRWLIPTRKLSGRR